MSGSVKTFFVVVGLPRSGTSSISQLLDNLGVYFGDKSKFLDATKHKHNPIFYELQWVIDFNDRVFAQWNSHYFHDEILPIESDFDTPAMRDLRSALAGQLRDEFGDRSLVGVKDPRICLTFPLWQRVLRDMGYEMKVVLTLRDSAATLRSIRK